MLTPEQLRRIHEAALDVLGETGVVFRNQKVADLCAGRGFAVEGFRVRMTAERVETALSTVPSSFVLEARNPARNLFFGEEGLVVATAAGPALTLEGSTMRPATDEDLSVSIKLAHMAPNVDMIGFPLEPQDVPVGRRYDRSVECALTLTDKPLEYAISTADHLRTAMDTSEIIHGPGWAERPRAFVVVNSVSPLQFEEDACLAMLEMARRRQPVCVTPCAMGGTTGPVTAAGLLVLQHAETLAGLTLVQTVQPGCPVVYGGVSSIASMVSGDILMGVPECWAIVTATVELARSLGLPCRSGGGLTDSHLLDMQAGIESAMGLSSVIRAGVNFILHGSGIVSSFNAFSQEKLLIDDETVGMLRALRRGVEVSEETLAVDVIKAVGPGGNYLLEEHTVGHCRDGERPSFFNRRKHDTWERHGALDIVARAAHEVRAMLEAYEAPEMNPETAGRLHGYALGRVAS